MAGEIARRHARAVQAVMDRPVTQRRPTLPPRTLPPIPPIPECYQRPGYPHLVSAERLRYLRNQFNTCPGRRLLLAEIECGLHVCLVCGDAEPTRLTVDHIVALVRGGPNELWNFQVLCGPCNSRKGDG